MFTLKFDQSGLLGMAAPEIDDATQQAKNFAFLRRIAKAVQNFDAEIKRSSESKQSE